MPYAGNPSSQSQSSITYWLVPSCSANPAAPDTMSIQISLYYSDWQVWMQVADYALKDKTYGVSCQYTVCNGSCNQSIPGGVLSFCDNMNLTTGWDYSAVSPTDSSLQAKALTCGQS